MMVHNSNNIEGIKIEYKYKPLHSIPVTQSFHQERCDDDNNDDDDYDDYGNNNDCDDDNNNEDINNNGNGDDVTSYGFKKL